MAVALRGVGEDVNDAEGLLLPGYGIIGFPETAGLRARFAVPDSSLQPVT